MPVRKSLCIKISSAVIFHGRELDLVSKCRQMNKLSYGKKQIGVRLGKKASAPLVRPMSKPIYINPLGLCTFRFGTLYLIYLFIYLVIYLLFIYFFLSFFLSLFIYLFIYLFVYLFTYLFIYLFIYLSIYAFIYSLINQLII